MFYIMNLDNLKYVLLFIITAIFVWWMVNSDWYCESSLNGAKWNDQCITEVERAIQRAEYNKQFDEIRGY